MESSPFPPTGEWRRLRHLRLLGVLHTQGPQIMSDLGDELVVTARYVTSLVNELEKEGLVPGVSPIPRIGGRRSSNRPRKAAILAS